MHRVFQHSLVFTLVTQFEGLPLQNREVLLRSVLKKFLRAQYANCLTCPGRNVVIYSVCSFIIGSWQSS